MTNPMTDPSPLETISERFYNEHQSWNYERIVKYGSLKLRVAIRSNAYNEQSYLRGFAFDPVHLQWNQLVNAPMVKSWKTSYVDDEHKANIERFRVDAMKIFGEMLQIIAD